MTAVLVTCAPLFAQVGKVDMQVPALLNLKAQGLVRAMIAQEDHNPQLFRLNGVVGTAVGVDENGTPIVKVFTDRANVPGLPRALNGFKVKSVFDGRFFAYPKGGNGGGNGGGKPGSGEPSVDPRDEFPRPVPIGVSVSPDINSCYAGTLGCRLRSSSGYFMLSNNHVLANENTGQIQPGGDPIQQPGLLDSSCVTSASKSIGVLFDFVPISFSGTNTVDAAIALTSTSETGTGTPSNGYGTPTSSIVTAYPGQPVMKYGRTTGQTYGTVDAVNWSGYIGYSNGNAYFTGQIIIRGEATQRGKKIRYSQFSAGGDSGSLIVEGTSRAPVGLLFAGSSTFTIANEIGTVLDELESSASGNLTIDDGN